MPYGEIVKADFARMLEEEIEDHVQAQLTAGNASDTGDDSLANVRRLRAELAVADRRWAAEVSARTMAETRVEQLTEELATTRLERDCEADAVTLLSRRGPPERPYAANDHAIEVGELTKQRDELAGLFAWVGDPTNLFSYSVYADGSTLVRQPCLGRWPTLLDAVRAARRAAQEARS